MIAKSASIKGAGGKSGGRVSKAVELIAGDLLHVSDSRLRVKQGSCYLTIVMVISLDFTFTPSKSGIDLETRTIYLPGDFNTYILVNTIASVTHSRGLR